MKILKYNLELAVFVCGAVVMVYELVGSRVLGPYFGTSIFVWTSLIGIILGSLSLGYWLGGKVADRKPDLGLLALIVFLASVSIGATLGFKDGLLEIFQTRKIDIRLASTVASIVLFAPTSVLLGMVSPFAAKLRIGDLGTSGSRIGNLYALSTAGSIVGTFLSGFYLIPRFGTNRLMLILSLVLFLISAWLAIGIVSWRKTVALSILFVALAATSDAMDFGGGNGVIDVDTAYSRVWIFDQMDRRNGKTVKYMQMGGVMNSGMYLESDELVYDYTKFYHLARHFRPGFRTALMMGGAGYSFPKEFLKRYPDATLNVVEIDPGITALAKRYFRLGDDPRLAIIHEDGRVVLNRTEKKYDVILGDAFSSYYSVPYQLTTREAVQKQYEILNDEGVVVVNLVASIEGRKSQFLQAEYETFKKIFPQVYLFPVSQPDRGDQPQNVMLVALKSDKKPVFENEDPELEGYLAHLWSKPVPNDSPILTDDFAPVDYYTSKLL